MSACHASLVSRKPTRRDRIIPANLRLLEKKRRQKRPQQRLDLVAKELDIHYGTLGYRKKSKTLYKVVGVLPKGLELNNYETGRPYPELYHPKNFRIQPKIVG